MKRLFGVTLVVLIAGTAGCSTGTCSIAFPAPDELKHAAFSARATVRRNLQVLDVFIQNTGPAPIQLLPQEWSITTPDGNTTAAAPGDVPNRDIAGIVLAPISLPAGANHHAVVFPRNRHRFHPGSGGWATQPYWSIDPMIPVGQDLIPDCTKVPATADIKLTIVALVDGARVIETLTVPVKISRTE